MLKTLRNIVLVGIVVSAVFVSIFITMPSIRQTVYFTCVRVLPEAYYKSRLQHSIYQENFGQASEILQKYLSIVNAFAKGNNTLLPGLINATEYVVEAANLPSEHASLNSYLSLLVESFPDLQPARIWLAKSLSETNPVAAFDHLDYARKLVSVDDRPYRVAINIALQKGLEEKLGEWCSKYYSSQFGGVHYEPHTNFKSNDPGAGLRTITLEVFDESGCVQRIKNHGIQLGESNEYDFPLDTGLQIKRLRLWIDLIPGISITVEKMRAFLGGSLVTSVHGNLIMDSSNGFFADDGTIISTSRNSILISLYTTNGEFGKVDRITFTMKFKRLALTNHLVNLK